MDVMFWVWLGFIVATVVLELATMELVSVWFAFGAIVPFILSIFKGIPIWVGVVAFVVVSAILVVFVRKYAQSWLTKNSESKTNLEALRGRKSRLLESITEDDDGAVKFNGIVWSAISVDDEPIEKGNFVEVVKIKGNKLVVKLSEKTKSAEKTKEEIGEKAAIKGEE